MIAKKIKIILICLLVGVGLCGQVKDWPYGEAEDLRKSSLDYLERYMMFGNCEDYELSRWQFYKYTLRRDSFPIVRDTIVLDSIKTYHRMVDTVRTKRGPVIITTDSVHTQFYHKMIQDTIWKCELPSFIGFMEWRL